MSGKENRLKIECTITLSHAHFQSLRMLYSPLLGKEALSLYETLYSLAKQSQQIKNHLLICKLCGFSFEVLEEKRVILETHLLIKTYFDGAKNLYLYELQYPKYGCDFLAHEVFGRLYMDKMGKQVYEFMKKSFAVQSGDKKSYQEISTHMSDLLRNWDDEQEEQFLSEKPDPLKEPCFFRFDRFLNDLSPMILPLSERTKENLDFIAEKAKIYGINEMDMRKLVGKSMDLKSNRLDRKKLVNKMKKHKSTNVAVPPKDPYDISSKQFLQQRQNNIELSKSDLNLLDLLNDKYHMSSQVINVLLEYVMERNQQSLARNYVEKVAAAWVRLGIDTKDKALAYCQKESQQTNYASQQSKQLPQWFYEQDVSETRAQEEAVSDEELMEQLRKLRGQHG